MRFVIVVLAIHAIAMTVLMGVGVTAVLAAGLPGSKPILIAAATGFVLAVPVTWIVTRLILAKAARS
ncbi:hypothetical protein [Novosphingobium malaysiense]|uniref:CTP synthetase n=1 Tax=Novosphingobium malaysiense TaxID=1348853 RepID=A0A0B1ZTI5_9SPHN|nr:hypothetical protein [Novosphingobium malaysiense]KHK92448.1 hypothetical protein LK12_06495 [Novosphingobium malaysiense]